MRPGDTQYSEGASLATPGSARQGIEPKVRRGRVIMGGFREPRAALLRRQGRSRDPMKRLYLTLRP